MAFSATEQERAAACWRHQDCGSCLDEKRGCGWCPASSICVPASTLLDPVSHKHICPFESERFELRTKALGCGCSTTTLLSVIVTVFATLAALALLYGLVVALRALNPFLGTGRAAGWEIQFKDDGAVVEKAWRRKGPWYRFRRQVLPEDSLRTRSEQEARTERSRLLG